MKRIGQYLSRCLERYRALSLRERGLVAVTLLAATWGIWAVTLGDYLTTAERRMAGSVDGVEQRLRNALAERARLQAALARDPDQALLAERERLDSALREMNAALGGLLERFVEPERMPALLEDVIVRHRGLKLTRLEGLPAEPLDVAGEREDGQAAEPLWIYRHPMVMEFEGEYFDVLAYLDELERGPWRFGWRELRYEVEDYPLARVTLELETLSRERNWLGV
jgi:MSHA biogenesis protein MshJ